MLRVAGVLLLWVVFAAPVGEVTVRLLMWKPDAPPVWEEAFRRAEARLARVKIVVDLAPHSTTDYHALLTQKLKNRDTSLDLFVMDVIWPAEFAAAGWVRPLGDRFPPEERAKFLPGVIAANTYRGRIYGLPSFVDAGLLYYRSDLLEKYGFDPPRTWPDLVRQARHISDREGPGVPHQLEALAQVGVGGGIGEHVRDRAARPQEPDLAGRDVPQVAAGGGEDDE